jgi:PAS domain S-box-containing protein
MMIHGVNVKVGGPCADLAQQHGLQMVDRVVDSSVVKPAFRILDSLIRNLILWILAAVFFGGTVFLVAGEGSLLARVAAGCAVVLSAGWTLGRVSAARRAEEAPATVTERLVSLNAQLEEEIATTAHEHEQLEHYFEMLMANVPANLYFKDAESRFLRVNQSMATWFGRGHPQDLVGKTDHDVFTSEHADQALEDERKILSTGRSITGLVEKEIFPDGKKGWALTSKMPFRDRHGRIIGTFGMSSDITELVETQHALERERNMLRALIDGVPDKIFVRDLDRRYLVVNRAMMEWAGVSTPEQILGKTPEEYLPPSIVENGAKEDRRVFTEGITILNREWKMEVKDGDLRHLVTTKVPLRDADGKIWGLVGMHRDVTDQRRAREQLIQSEQRMQEMIDNSPAVIWLKDLSGKYQMVNLGFEKLVGLHRDEVLGKTDLDLFTDKDVAQSFRNHDMLVVERGESLQVDEEFTVDGEKHTYVSVRFPLRDLRGNIHAIGSISTDITDRKAAEESMRQLNEDLVSANEDLRRAHEQLIQAEKMESVGRLAAGVAHEVKNPLAMIGMGIELLARRVPADDVQAQETIERMKRGVDRAKKIVKGLVDYSSARQLSLEYRNVTEVIEDSIALVDYPLRKAGVQLTKEFQPDVPEVMVDSTKLEQVLVNLMINAMHAMGEGGKMHIYTQALVISGVRRDEGLRTAAHIREGDSVVRIILEDNGPGIDEGHLSKVFDPFFTTKPTGVGTGLGLAVCRKIIDLHRGSLDLENRPEGGLRVTITLKVGDIQAAR